MAMPVRQGHRAERPGNRDCRYGYSAKAALYLPLFAHPESLSRPGWGSSTGPERAGVYAARAKALIRVSEIFVESGCGVLPVKIRSRQMARRSAARASRKDGVALEGYQGVDDHDGRSP